MIEGVLPQSRRRERLVEYYDSISNCSACLGNPFFWLQYAIARMSLGEYALAESYLETAYDCAKRTPGFRTYQIDNQKARLLLEKTVAENLESESFQAFHSAIRIIMRQIKEGSHRHYPYRVAALVGPFLEAFFSGWPPGHQQVARRSVDVIRSRIDSVRGELRKHRDVIACAEALAALSKRGIC